MSGRSWLFLLITVVVALLGFVFLSGAIAGLVKFALVAFLIILFGSIMGDKKPRKQNPPPPPPRPSSSGTGRR